MTSGIIGIIGAMQEEMELFLHDLEGMSRETKAGTDYYAGKLFGRDVVVCKSGVGKVNAAVCTQVLIDRYGVGTVLFTGVAGALHPELEIGDLVVSTECMQHDMDVTPLGFARGVIPYADVSVFPADDALVRLAKQAGERLYGKTPMSGRVLSGDQFVASRETVRSLYEQLGGVCTEMEGAAVAQVCHLNGVPYVVIRSMSDKADGSAHVNFAEFTPLAAKHSYEMVREMIRLMNAS